MAEYMTVDPDNPESRSAMRRAAEDRARELSAETDLDHRMRWDKDNSRYVVERTPFVEPAKPWDDDFYPDRRSPNFERSPTRFVKLDELLVGCANLTSYQWISSNERPASPARFKADLQAALDVQYGRGRFWAYRHGDYISIQCRYPIETA